MTIIPDPERSARIIERQVVGDGSESDETLRRIACQVRRMDTNVSAIAN